MAADPQLEQRANHALLELLNEGPTLAWSLRHMAPGPDELQRFWRACSLPFVLARIAARYGPDSSAQCFEHIAHAQSSCAHKRVVRESCLFNLRACAPRAQAIRARFPAVALGPGAPVAEKSPSVPRAK